MMDKGEAFSGMKGVEQIRLDKWDITSSKATWSN